MAIRAFVSLLLLLTVSFQQAAAESQPSAIQEKLEAK